MADRSQAYWEKDRTKPIAYEFPYQKTVRASVTGGGQTISADQSKFDDFYSTDRHIPKAATLTSIDISTEGFGGTVNKATVNFTIHDIRNIGAYEVGLLRPGTDITINYGWSGDGKSQGGGEFKGNTFNFSFSMNNYGGADCTLECLGKGSTGWRLLSQEIKTGAGESSTDEHQQNIPLNTITAFIRSYIDKARGKLKKNSMSVDDVGFFEINGGQEPEKEEEEDSNSFSHPGWYVTLKKLIWLTNRYIIYPDYKPLNEEPQAPYMMLPSGDYLKFAFPGEGVYNNKVVFAPMNLTLLNAPKSPEKFYGNVRANLGNVLVNVNYLFSIFNRDIAKTDDRDVTIGKLFETLFKDLAEVSGGAYNLTFSNIVADDGEVSPHIIDISQYYGESDVTHTFTPFVEGSTVRQMSLSTQLPELLAKEMYLAARGQATQNRLVNFMLDKQNTSGGVQQQTAQTEIYGNQTTSVDQFKIREEKNYDNIYEEITKLKKLLAEHNGESQATVQLIAAIKEAVRQDPDSSSSINNAIYPLNLSVTIDGIEGIKFGHYITSSWLPRKYQKGLDFMVMKVSHKITTDDWVTEIETQCRVK